MFEKLPFDYKIENNRLIWRTEGELVWLEPYGDNAIRFRSSASLKINEDLNWTLLAPSSNPSVKFEEQEDKVTMHNGKISVELLDDGTVNYLNHNKEYILKEYWIDLRIGTAPQRKAREYRSISSNAYKMSIYFQANEGESFYGMGQDPNDCFNQKGSTIELTQKNSKCVIPYYYSTKGYGFIWNNPSIGRAELTNNNTMWHSEACQQIDYIIFADDSPEKVMGKLTEITGRAEVLPEWAAGFWQCKLRYRTQDELLDVAREYKRRNIPLSVIVVDYFHWTQQGEWKFNPNDWPDPKAMVDELDEMGIKLMVSVWPTVDPRSENYEEMRTKNLLIRAERGTSNFFMFQGPETYVDTTNPEARQYLWSKLKQHYYDLGIKMFWLDEAEPELRPYDYENVRYLEGNGLETSSIYPYYYGKALQDGMKSEGETEIVNLIRCAWLGSQRTGVVLWSGDIASTFDSLRKQIKAGLNVAMCGIPWWTTDIGGFLFGDPDDEKFRELMIRWFQFGVFCPIFRLHGYRLPYGILDNNNFDPTSPTGGPNEVWSFGEQAYDIITKLIQLRDRLMPYIMEHMKIASATGTPMMRPLVFDFQDDTKVHDIGDQYMFGSDLMVAPIIEASAVKRNVYFPEGTQWTCAKTGERYVGGETYEISAPIDTIPLFLREGCSLPIYQ